MAYELPIPPAANRDTREIEMIRVWLAENKQHSVLNVGFWQEKGLEERHCWGILLADMIHHIANAHEEEFGWDVHESISLIREAFNAEMENPTSERRGEFVRQRRSHP
jgi:hypothetical protein